MAKQTINNTNVNPDSLYAAAQKINANFTENYDAIAALQAAPGGGGAATILAGKIATGYLEFVSADNVANTAVIKVAPGTTVIVPQHKGGGLIYLTAGNFTLALGNGHDWVLYCDYLGALAVAHEANLPAANIVTLMYSTTWYVNFNLKPLIPTNHYFPSDPTYRNPDFVATIDMADFGAAGDDLTNNDDVFTKCQTISWDYNSRGVPVQFYLKAGTYRITAPGGWFTNNASLVGQSKTTTIIKSINAAAPPQFNVARAQSLTFLDVKVYDYAVGNSFNFKDVKFISTVVSVGNMYLLYLSNLASEYLFEGCDFVFNNIYAGLYLFGAKSVVVKNCTFTGDAWHNLRIEVSQTTALGLMEIRNNIITGGTTGIFFGSNRFAPVENIIVENNTLIEQKEESISFDGFGNNAALCPVICSGTIASASNDVNGRLVIQPSMVYHDGVNPNVASPVSLRNDWTKFYFTLEEGSGREGVFTKIVAFDATANTFTLDLYAAAANITVGGHVGVHAGFFNCRVKDNKVIGSVGAGNNYATAISIYLNVFGMVIENNTIVGCANGINLAGGLMLSTYRLLAFGNIVKNNSFLSTGEVVSATASAIAFRSYSALVKQFGNQFVGNTVVGGKIFFERQQKMVYEGNNINDASAEFSYCGNTLPAANASQVGKRFMLITDDVNGVPTAINYYVCKLAAGTYSWVAV